MNRPVLDKIIDWMVDCLIDDNQTKADKLELIYNRMFDK
jgi:hypothetical protein